MEGSSERSRTRFVAQLITPRTIAIFAAGFLLALLLARLLPGTEVFHPVVQVRTIDTLITIASVEDDLNLSIGTEAGIGFGTISAMWDGTLLEEVKRLAGDPMSVPARITYVIPNEGAVVPVFIRAPE